MTKEEISSARALCALGQTTFSARVYRDYCERALGLLPQALSALEEANREIAQLKAHVCSLRCSDEAKSEDHEPGCPFFTGTYA